MSPRLEASPSYCGAWPRVRPCRRREPRGIHARANFYFLPMRVLKLAVYEVYVIFMTRLMVDRPGFEPGTSRVQTERSSGLSYRPINCYITGRVINLKVSCRIVDWYVNLHYACFYSYSSKVPDLEEHIPYISTFIMEIT